MLILKRRRRGDRRRIRADDSCHRARRGIESSAVKGYPRGLYFGPSGFMGSRLRARPTKRRAPPLINNRRPLAFNFYRVSRFSARITPS